MPNAVSGAQAASINPGPGLLASTHLRQLIVALIALTLALTMIAVLTPVDAQAHPVGGAAKSNAKSEAARVVRYAKSHLGARFRMGAEGPRYFDCSGLIYRVYQQAGLLNKIGGGRKVAASYYRWFRQRGLVSRSNARVGDLIWWTTNGRISHMGLYIGNGRALSALTTGVRTHTLRGISVKLLGFGNVQISR